MAVYYTIFILTLLLAKCIPADADRKYFWKLVWVFLPLFLFGALRVDFSLDYAGYEQEYYELHSSRIIDPDHHSEIGYQLLEIIMPTWRSILILNAFATAFSWVYICFKFIKDYQLPYVILLMFLIGNLTIYTPIGTIRNGIAIAAFLLSLPLIIKRRYITVMVIAVLAHYIHTSVLLFAPIALLLGRNTPITIKELTIWISSFAVLFILGASSIMNFLNDFISAYFGRYDTVLAGMMDSKHDSWLAISSSSVLLIVMFSVFYNNREYLNEVDNSLFRIGSVYLICPFLGAMGGARMMCYFVPVYIIILVRMAYWQWSYKIIKVSFYALAIVHLGYSFFYVWMLKNPYNVFQTYKCIFGEF